MRTKNPVSNISYNTENGLRFALGELHVPFWLYIFHKAEPAIEMGQISEKKNHYHFYIQSDNVVDTDKFTRFFYEEIGSDCGVKLSLWNTSKFEDFYLYGLHDVDYLRSKGQTRYYHYLHEDYRTNNPDLLVELVNRIDRSKYARGDYLGVMARAWDMGVRDFAELIAMYRPPIQQYSAWQKAWFDYSQYRINLERNPRDRKACAYVQYPHDNNHRPRAKI